MMVVIRADASLAIGSGHVMRCLTLAEMLRDKGSRIMFVCRELPGNLCGLVEDRGFMVHRLHGAAEDGRETPRPCKPGNPEVAAFEADAEQTMAAVVGKIDWLIVDHYGLDARWESRLRAAARRIMVIDDLADRPHDCDLLLDQNLYENYETRYRGLVPETCKLLLGPRHALLRKEFIEARRELRGRDGMLRRLLIFMGGSDSTNETGKAIEALWLLNRPDIAVDIVIGNTNPHKEAISRACSLPPNTSLFVQVETMARMMAAADLSIGGGGTATWERCYLGLPTIIIVLADNQKEIAEAVAAAGAARNLGWREKVEPRHIVDAVRDFLVQPEVLCEMGKKAVKLVGNPEGKSGNSLCRVLLGENIAPA